MFALDAPNADGQVVLLVCSSLGAPRDGAARPYGPRSWAKLAKRIGASELGAPARLLDVADGDIGPLLDYPPAEAARLVELLERRGQLAFELERLRARGIWVQTIADAGYPDVLRARLGVDAPPVLFGSGEPSLLARGGIAVVGSREADAEGLDFTRRLASAAATGGTQIVSGGARGVDQEAMRAAVERGGTVVGALAEGLERRIRDAETRSLLADGSVAMITPYHPSAPFSAGAAMARNKLIYALSDVAVVVSSAEGQGGTWAGAIEALEAGWVPVLVRDGDGVPAGNRALRERGASPLGADSASSELSPGTLLSAVAAPGRVAEQPARDAQQAFFFDD